MTSVSCVPPTAASASTGGFRHGTSGVGIGAIAIASDLLCARLINPELKEHLADAQGRAPVMDDDLDLLRAGHYHGMTTDVAPDLSRTTARLTGPAAWRPRARHRPLMGRVLPGPPSPASGSKAKRPVVAVGDLDTTGAAGPMTPSERCCV
jgi:hypothetical protein